MTENDQSLLNYVEFVATKFTSSIEGWTYSNDLGDLEHIRYKSDYTGRNHWTCRLRRALNWKSMTNQTFLRKHLRTGKFDINERIMQAFAWIVVSLKKDKHLPDGRVGGNLTFWEEDGEYIEMMGPTVGVKVIEFLRADPENPYARAILDEMHSIYKRSAA